jgi:ribosomal protein L7/L12
MSAESLNCPNCGAPLPEPAGRPTVVCDHCGSVIAFKPPQPAADTPPAASEPRYEYGQAPSQRPARSDLTSVALGPTDAAHVIQLLRAGQQLEAIQVYQSKVGGSLGEAQDAIDAILAGLQDAAAPIGPALPMTRANPADLPEVLQYLTAGNRLEAIRVYRAATGAGLREAVTAIDSLQRDLGGAPPSAPLTMSAPARSGSRSCFGGCTFAGLGVVALLLCILGGCGSYVQTTAIYKCSLRDIKAALAAKEILTPPINGGYLVLVPGFKQTGDLSNWHLSAEYFAPVWGAQGWGIVDAHVVADSSGYNNVSAKVLKDGHWRPVLTSGQIQCRS